MYYNFSVTSEKKCFHKANGLVSYCWLSCEVPYMFANKKKHPNHSILKMISTTISIKKLKPVSKGTLFSTCPVASA